MKHWHVVHTQPRSETKALWHLENQGFEPYLPFYRKRRRHARRFDTVFAPLFPRYLFVALDVERDAWRSINGTRGVSYLISRGDRPLAVPDELIEEIRSRTDEDGVVRLEPSRFRYGQRLHISDGPFAEMDGMFQEMAGEERVVLLLNLLGRPVRAAVPLSVIGV